MATDTEKKLERELEKAKSELASTKAQLAATPAARQAPKAVYWTTDVEEAGRYLAVGAPLAEVVARTPGSPRMGKKYGFAEDKKTLDARVTKAKAVEQGGAV